MSKRDRNELDRLEYKLGTCGLNKQERARYNRLADIRDNEQELAFLQGQF